MAKETLNMKSVGKLQMSSFKALLCALVLIAWTLIVGHCQDVDKTSDSAAAIRASGVASTRGVYSPRLAYGPHHQIMHFGKRPAIVLPSRVYDLYWQQKARQQQLQQAAAAANKFPMEPLEEEMAAFEFSEPIVQNRMPIYSIISHPNSIQQDQTPESFSLIDTMPFGFVNKLAQAQQQQLNANQGKFSSRLISNNADSGESSNDSDSSRLSSDQQQQSMGISVATRSPHSAGRTSSFDSASSNGGKNFISTLLLGRASTPSMGANFGSFIKKAEPKDNVFMHFGRK